MLWQMQKIDFNFFSFHLQAHLKQQGIEDYSRYPKQGI